MERSNGDGERQLAVLFADISDSTRLYELHGDRVAHGMTSEGIVRMTACVISSGGRVIKTIGDEILAVFPTAPAAHVAALAMQEVVRTLFPIRVGFHFGPVLEKGGDVFGDTVNVAARMVSIATSGEIVFSENAYIGLSQSARDDSRFLDDATLKGKALPMRIYKVVEGQEDATFVGAGEAVRPKPEHALKVVYRGMERLVTESDTTVTLGRNPDCSILVSEACASRAHAKIYRLHGKYLIVDYSSNGTYIFHDLEDKPIFVKRETVQLGKSGRIYLGTTPKDNYDGVVMFDMID
ncbi:MAG: adenylate/guanylate cyclase domain-containing protein [Alphaproteobacteria bacterium]